ncbi:aldehyde dehydrogenase family protein [Sinorhizobium meliloti]|uniref:aldehyde dehydrogenase family protein n=1 Tax=Rhizobium meliloti TaxID=382 RepID=UPI003F178B3F
MITRNCAPAMTAGCPVIVNPSEFTPFSPLAQQVGLPDGIKTVLTACRRGSAAP